jgi:hypothetical protein
LEKPDTEAVANVNLRTPRTLSFRTHNDTLPTVLFLAILDFVGSRSKHKRAGDDLTQTTSNPNEAARGGSRVSSISVSGAPSIKCCIAEAEGELIYEYAELYQDILLTVNGTRDLEVGGCLFDLRFTIIIVHLQ